MSDVSARLGELIDEVMAETYASGVMSTRDALVLLVYKIETDPTLTVEKIS